MNAQLQTCATSQNNIPQNLLASSFPLKLDSVKTTELKAYFQSAWFLYEWLFSGLAQESSEANSIQPNPFRNQLVFYYGHTAAFYANRLQKAGLLTESIAPWDESMTTGVWPKSAGDISVQSWPSFQELKIYRQTVYDKIITLLDCADIPECIDENSPWWALVMGIEHDYIHFQTSIPLIRRAPLEILNPPENWKVCSDHMPKVVQETPWLSFEGGEIAIGRSQGENQFYGWDNEYGCKQVEVQPFQIQQCPVTNREFLQFVEAGGYEDKSWWSTPEVDVWFETLNPQHPEPWVKSENGDYQYRAPFEMLPMQWDWPVEVNKHEAAAYAKWAGARLITESEYHYLLQEEYPTRECLLEDLTNKNVNMKYGSPVPVGKLVAENSKTQVDIFGNVCFWANESFQALNEDSFNAHDFYPDFSIPWFRGDHTVLLGANYTSLGHTAHIGIMRDFMQNHMSQIAGIILVKANV